MNPSRAVRLVAELLFILVLAAAAFAAFSLTALALSGAWRFDALFLAATILLFYPATAHP